MGLGASRARWFYLPNAHTDFIFAIIGEETGLIGGLTVIGLYIVLALAGWMVAVRAPDRFGRMIAAGLTAWLTFQAIVNIGGVLGVMPITGISLPFVSFGSTSLIVCMASLGILVNIAQAGVQPEDMTFLIAAAGTGGHVFPGLAVGEALLARGIPKESILYVGGDRLEKTVYPDAGFPFLQVEVRGLQRSMTMRNLSLPRVVWRARDAINAAIEERGVKVVLGMGGYVTIPAALATRSSESVLIVAEQNAGGGLANRIASRWATRIFTSFPDTEGLKRGEWVGNPVRQALSSLDREERQAAGAGPLRPRSGIPRPGRRGRLARCRCDQWSRRRSGHDMGGEPDPGLASHRRGQCQHRRESLRRSPPGAAVVRGEDGAVLRRQ